MHGGVRQVAPVRVQGEQRGQEHQQRQAQHADRIVHDGERRPPDHHPGQQPDQRHPQQIIDITHQLDRQCHSADLGRNRQQVQRERADQVHHAQAHPEPLTHQVEDRAARDRRDPPGHLPVDHHGHRAQHGPPPHRALLRVHKRNRMRSAFRQ